MVLQTGSITIGTGCGESDAVSRGPENQGGDLDMNALPETRFRVSGAFAGQPD
ncbi:hypothetical protein ACFSBZ_09610 [Amnibacterium flavum]|uniref:hypothetical protein n=1 Tax=Amnibacterium flavum TaxID=2173173 RepID=UPI0014023C63|nr:hypothetical protein [Amnibacterium flavum]